MHLKLHIAYGVYVPSVVKSRVVFFFLTQVAFVLGHALRTLPGGNDLIL